MRVLISLFCVSVLSGCAIFDDEYTCGDVPEANCMPVSEVYKRPYDGDNSYEARVNGKDDDQETVTPVIKVAPAHRVLNYTSPGDPVLTKPVIMRVLYRSFENDQKDLDAGGYTYLRMRESEWVLQKN